LLNELALAGTADNDGLSDEADESRPLHVVVTVLLVVVVVVAPTSGRHAVPDLR